MTRSVAWPVLLCALAFVSGLAVADDHQHHGPSPDTKEPVQRPRVFLDKNRRIVMYQLNRLDNTRLLLVERRTDHTKYAPVFEAILSRRGMSRQHREEALAGLVKINKSDVVSELVTILDGLDIADRGQQRVGRQLAAMLLTQPTKQLDAKTALIKASTESKNPILRSSGYAALVIAGKLETALSLAARNDKARFDFVKSVPLIPNMSLRSKLRPAVVDALSAGNSESLRRAAVTALASIPSRRNESFRLLASLIEDKRLMTAAVRALLRIPAASRDAATAEQLVERLVDHAETTPAKDRTTSDFIDAMQLADQLLTLLPVDKSRAFRQRLDKVTVRVVQIHTVEEEMRFDTPYFAVEAGRDVQIVLINEDLMPHNLVITANGALREVAAEGVAAGPDGGDNGKPYVPKSDKVLFATSLVAAGKQERLTFTAPKTPGEYPFVCTFPRHWMRMYGVMVVVEDLDAWLKNPTKPADPIGNTREFVQAWKMTDFDDALRIGLQGRSPAIGQKIFSEATCAQCHKFRGEGGAVGPELTDVFQRYKGDTRGILREILDPSHKIDPKYAVHVVVTLQGKVVSGIVLAENKDAITIIDNPEAAKPTVIKQEDVDDVVKSSKSMMPKALLDQFSKDEILELLAFLNSGSGK